MQGKIKIFIKNNACFIGVMLFILWVSFINVFPKGRIFSGGDVVQFFNFPKILGDFGYTWSNLFGEGFFLQYFSYNIYYLPFYLISCIFHISPSGQSFLYFFIFLAFSFWSFYLGLGFYEKNDGKLSKNYKVIFSLFYAFNSYTLYNFYYTWGYSPFLFLYALIPVIFGATFKFFSAPERSERNRLLAILGIFFFLSNIPNGNLPFFISLNIFLFLFVILIFVFRDKDIRVRDFLKNIILYYATYFFCVFWSVVPQVPEMFRQLKVFNNGGSVFDLKQWLLWQAVELKDIFFINVDINGLVKSISFFGFFSIVIFVSACLSMLLVKRKEKKAIIYAVLLVLCMFLLNKGKGILSDDFIWKIFSNPILSSLRSYDKVAIFLPFFSLIIIFLSIIRNFKRYKYILIALLFLNSLSVYPFFLGGIQTKYSAVFQDGENYRNSQYSYLHKIPDEYFNLAGVLNEGRLDSKLFGVPYGVLNSVGWVNFPKWQVVGVDPTIQLFNKPVIQMNSFSAFGIWNYGEFWNSQNNNESLWILPFSGLLNSQYIIYHKDVDGQFIRQTQDKIKYYEQNKLLLKLEDNDYFNLYKINADYFLPHLYVPWNLVSSTMPTEFLPRIAGDPDFQISSAIYFAAGNSALPVEIKDGAKNYLALFQKGGVETSSVIDLTAGQASQEFSLYRGLNPDSAVDLQYLPGEGKVTVGRTANGIVINGESTGERGETLLEISVQRGDLLNFGEEWIFIQDGWREKLKVRDISGGIKAYRLKDAVRIPLENGSFESGLWNKKVLDCSSNEKGAPVIGMAWAADSSAGRRSLELISKSHSACAQKFFPVRLAKDGFYQLSFDFKNVGNGAAAYYYTLIGKNGTTYSRLNYLRPAAGGWSAKGIFLKPPEDIEKVVLSFIAIPDAEGGEAVSRFDNVILEQLDADLIGDFPLASGDLFIRDVKLNPGQNKVELPAYPALPSSAYDYYLKSRGGEGAGLAKAPVLEFKKINPTKYRVAVHGAAGNFPLVFSESFHSGWKVYPVKSGPAGIPPVELFNGAGNYEILSGNEGDQATAEELAGFVKDGYVSDLGRGKVGFVSKNFQGTIQNDNLPAGHLWETWFRKPLAKKDHLTANGFANSWWIDLNEVKQSGRYVANADGTYDFELVLEFWPQRLFCLGALISILTLLGCVGYLVWGFRRRASKH